MSAIDECTITPNYNIMNFALLLTEKQIFVDGIIFQSNVNFLKHKISGSNKIQAENKFECVNREKVQKLTN